MGSLEGALGVAFRGSFEDGRLSITCDEQMVVSMAAAPTRFVRTVRALPGAARPSTCSGIVRAKRRRTASGPAPRSVSVMPGETATMVSLSHSEDVLGPEICPVACDPVADPTCDPPDLARTRHRHLPHRLPPHRVPLHHLHPPPPRALSEDQ